MARPLIGASARTEVVSVRITEEEKQELVRKYGTAAKGLRALLSAALVRSK